ncbi:SHOCT domain-containing protein [Clostridium sp. YIM B02569]|nr:SHOCT domain-containing protein [Clostridium sp. YIM B02569]
MRKIKGLKEDGIISEEEYEAKRKEILSEKW